MTAAEAEGPVAPRARLLLVSRAVEQASLGLASLALARQLGPSGFAPISVLYVVYALGLTASDYGLGLGALRLEPGRTLRSRSLRDARVVNTTIAVATVVAGPLVGSGQMRWVIALAGPMWAASSESYVRRSAALKASRGDRRVARAEIVAALAFAILAAVAATATDAAPAIVGAAFLVKFTLESVLAGSAGGVFSPDGDRGGVRYLWGTELVAFLVANLDYLAIGLAFSPAQLAEYVVAFRIVSVGPSQLSYVFGRVAVVELSAAPTDEARDAVYGRYARRLALLGVAAGLATLAVAPLIPVLLGDAWRPTSRILVVLAIALPWRLTLGLTGGLMVTADRAATLLRWDLSRLVALAVALGVATAVSFRATVVVVVLVEIAVGVAYQRGATRGPSIETPRRLVVWAVIAGLAALAASPLIGG